MQRHRIVGWLVATVGLIAVLFALVRIGRTVLSAAAVTGWTGVAYWFTSSASFANPAVTATGRMFSDTLLVLPRCGTRIHRSPTGRWPGGSEPGAAALPDASRAQLP